MALSCKRLSNIRYGFLIFAILMIPQLGWANPGLYEAVSSGTSATRDYLNSHEVSEEEFKYQNPQENLDTPLHYAIRNNKLKIVKIILKEIKEKQCFSVLGIPNKDQLIPVEFARSQGNNDENNDIVEVFEIFYRENQLELPSASKPTEQLSPATDASSSLTPMVSMPQPKPHKKKKGPPRSSLIRDQASSLSKSYFDIRKILGEQAKMSVTKETPAEVKEYLEQLEIRLKQTKGNTKKIQEVFRASNSIIENFSTYLRQTKKSVEDLKVEVLNIEKDMVSAYFSYLHYSDQEKATWRKFIQELRRRRLRTEALLDSMILRNIFDSIPSEKEEVRNARVKEEIKRLDKNMEATRVGLITIFMNNSKIRLDLNISNKKLMEDLKSFLDESPEELEERVRQVENIFAGLEQRIAIENLNAEILRIFRSSVVQAGKGCKANELLTLSALPMDQQQEIVQRCMDILNYLSVELPQVFWRSHNVLGAIFYGVEELVYRYADIPEEETKDKFAKKMAMSLFFLNNLIPTLVDFSYSKQAFSLPSDTGASLSQSIKSLFSPGSSQTSSNAGSGLTRSVSLTHSMNLSSSINLRRTPTSPRMSSTMARTSIDAEEGSNLDTEEGSKPSVMKRLSQKIKTRLFLSPREEKPVAFRTGEEKGKQKEAMGEKDGNRRDSEYSGISTLLLMPFVNSQLEEACPVHTYLRSSPMDLTSNTSNTSSSPRNLTSSALSSPRSLTSSAPSLSHESHVAAPAAVNEKPLNWKSYFKGLLTPGHADAKKALGLIDIYAELTKPFRN